MSRNNSSLAQGSRDINDRACEYPVVPAPIDLFQRAARLTVFPAARALTGLFRSAARLTVVAAAVATPVVAGGLVLLATGNMQWAYGAGAAWATAGLAFRGSMLLRELKTALREPIMFARDAQTYQERVPVRIDIATSFIKRSDASYQDERDMFISHGYNATTLGRYSKKGFGSLSGPAPPLWQIRERRWLKHRYYGQSHWYLKPALNTRTGRYDHTIFPWRSDASQGGYLKSWRYCPR